LNSWVVTIPKSTKWEDYEKELKAVEDEGLVLNYRVRYMPKGIDIDDRVYIVHDGMVRGFHPLLGIKNWPNGFVCETTGTEWPPGIYLQRTGRFYRIDPIPMQGFRGLRRFDQPVTQLDGVTERA
jgi:hypothetical protein